MEAHAFKLYNVPYFTLKTGEFQCFEVCYPETSSCASNLLYVRCKAVKPLGLCQVSLGLKVVQMGAHDFKLIKVTLFSRKSVNINVSLSAAPKLALVYFTGYLQKTCHW